MALTDVIWCYQLSPDSVGSRQHTSHWASLVELKISSGWSHITKGDKLNEMAQYISLSEGTDWTSSCMGGKEAEAASTGFARCNDVNWGYVELILVHFLFDKSCSKYQKIWHTPKTHGKIKRSWFLRVFQWAELESEVFLGGQIAWSQNIKIVVFVCPQL